MRVGYPGRWHRPLVYFAAAMAVSAVVAAVGLVVDDRMLVGAPIWAKPLKFSVSFVFYAGMWAWLMALQSRYQRVGWWLGTGIVVASVIEMVVIVGQTIRGHRSHFNTANDLDQTLWFIMGSTIGVLFLLNLVWVVLLWRQDLGDRSVTAALRLGAALSLVGMAVAFLMAAPTQAQIARMRAGADTITGAHSVGVADGGPGLPLLNWSTTGGDLRVPHFIGLHALQAVPLVAALLLLLAPRIAALRPQVRRARLIRVAAAGYAGLIGLTTWQALRGQPVVAPDALTLGVLGVLVVGVTAGVVLCLAGGRTDAEAEPAEQP